MARTVAVEIIFVDFPRKSAMQRHFFSALCIAALMPATVLAQNTQSTPGTEAPRRDPIFMLGETARFVDVVDSFDQGSTFSFRLSAGYAYQRRSLLIEREARTSDPLTGLGGVQYNRVGDYLETTSTLHLRAEIGIFQDFSLTIGVPLVLSNNRSIRAVANPTMTDGASALLDGWSQNASPTSLFSVPMDSPSRSGIDQIRLGLSWSILNQARDRTKPTWTIRAEWRPPVGDVMHACNASPAAGVADCPAPSSIPNQVAPGTTNAMGPALRPVSVGGPGISRGLHGLYFQTAASRRIGFIEPYAALDVLAEFPMREAPFRYFDTPYGQLASFPPIQGSLTVGAEITPWENRESWQRIALDFRIRGTYRSQGRDYSPLYDALGSSTSRALAVPGCPSNVRNPDGTCQPGRDIYFDGLTTVQSHVIVNGMISLAAQPLKILRFDIGLGISWVSPHLITATDACNPGEIVPQNHPEWRGGCVGDSAPDPTHRGVIDQSGGRFRTSGETLFDFFASVSLTPRFF
jgi:hypothetical protein